MPKRSRSAKPKPAAGENKARSAQSIGWPAVTCPVCGKKGYASRQAAKQAAVRIYPGKTMRFYQCGTLWHMTSVDSGTTAQYREWQAVQEEDS